MLHHCHLAGVVGHQADRGKPHAAQDIGPEAEVAFVILEAEPVVGLDRVKALILQGISTHLVGKPDAAAFLVEIKQDARTHAAHLGQRGAELWTAVAFERPEHIAGEAGGMQPGENGGVPVGATDLDGVMLCAAIVGPEDMQPSGFCRVHWKAGGGNRGQGVMQHEVFVRGLGGQLRQAMFMREPVRIGERHNNGSWQKLSRFDQRDGKAVQACVALPFGHKRAFHGHQQIIGGIRKAAHPFGIGIRGQVQAGKVAIIGARLEGFSTPIRDRQNRRADVANGREPGWLKRLSRQDRHAGATRPKHHGQTNAQVSAGAGGKLGRSGQKRHEVIRLGSSPLI